MKLFTDHLWKDAFFPLQQALVNRAVKAAGPDAVFLLGASFCHRTGESIFQEPAPAVQHLSHCVVLVLISRLAHKELHEWQDKIESHCKCLVPLTALVLETSRFKEWLKKATGLRIRYGGRPCLCMIAETCAFRASLPTPLPPPSAKGNTAKG